jgi:uncharacterized membrane protein
MNRHELDAFVDHHRLAPAAVEVALDIAQARPTRVEIARFTQQLLQLAGVLSLATGVIFFVAANWQDFRVMGRFVFIEALVIGCVVLALWKPPPHALGRYASMMAFIAIGALLALFGQTYQTGADVYELFLTWAALGLAFAIAGQWSLTWAAWLLVLNVALWLFCGARAETGWFWLLFAGWELELLLGPMLLNILLWLVPERLEKTQWSAVAPFWLGRLALTCAIGFGTWAGIIAILEPNFEAGNAGHRALALIVLVGIGSFVVFYTLRRRRDVFPLALVAGSFIVLTTCALARLMESSDLGAFFVVSLWLIASSTAGGRILMQLVRAWRTAGNAA